MTQDQELRQLDRSNDYARSVATCELTSSRLFPGNVIHGGFVQRAHSSPSSPAVVWEGREGRVMQLSYGGLRDWAWRISAWVREHRVGGPVRRAHPAPRSLAGQRVLGLRRNE